MKVVVPAAGLLLACMTGVSPALAQGLDAGRTTAPSRAVSVLQPSPFLGGVPTGTPTTEPIELTVTDAIRRALEHNLGLLNAENAVTRAHGSRWNALADLLPNVNGRITENRQRINLAAFGFPLPPGTPSLVGPFNVFDARVNVSQTVFDRRAIDEARAQGHAVRAAEHSVKSARELVVLVSANLYLQALAATARLESVQAQLQTAQAVFDQANDLKTAGLVAGIEVLRAEVQMSTQQQRVTAARNDLEIAKLQLARVVGLPPGQPFTISGELPFVPVPDMTVEAALERAYRARPDYLAAEERLRQAEAQRSAAGGEYLPSLRVNADYGAIGLSAADAEITYALSGVLNVPIFNGGRSRGRVIQADAELRTRQVGAGGPAGRHRLRRPLRVLRSAGHIRAASRGHPGSRSRGRAADAVARSLRGRRARATSRWCRHRRPWLRPANRYIEALLRVQRSQSAARARSRRRRGDRATTSRRRTLMAESEPTPFTRSGRFKRDPCRGRPARRGRGRLVVVHAGATNRPTMRRSTRT